jgi:hypothetical protein
MHIYCDESGGADSKSSRFVVAAAMISATDAARIVRRLRRNKVAASDEIKGHQMTLKHRLQFFDIIANMAVATSTVCDRKHRGGSYAMCTLSEHELWAELIYESVCRLPIHEPIGVTVDSGRYTREVISSILHPMQRRLAERFGCRVNIQAGESRSTHGIQIADVVANSVFHCLSSTGERKAAMLAMLKKAGIDVAHAELPGKIPDWLRVG